MRAIIGVILAILALTIIYVIFFVLTNYQQITEIMLHIDKQYLMLSILIWFFVMLTRTVRWHIFLKNITVKIPFKLNSIYFLAGYSFILSPGRLGEIIRSPLLKRDFGISISKSGSVMLVERFYDLLAVILLISIGLIFFNYEKTIILLPASVLVLMIILVRNKKTLKNTMLKISRFKYFQKTIINIDESVDTFSSLMTPKNFIIGFSISLLNASLEASSFYFLIIGLGSVINYGNMIVVYNTSTFIASASFVPGGIGVLEGGLIGLLTLLKIKYDIAVSSTLLIRLISTGIFSAIGFICFYKISRNNQKMSKVF